MPFEDSIISRVEEKLRRYSPRRELSNAELQLAYDEAKAKWARQGVELPEIIVGKGVVGPEIPPFSKKCTVCGVPKLLTEFHKSKSTHDGVVTRCKSCVSKYQKQLKFYHKKSW